jgi:hypothetical protein
LNEEFWTDLYGWLVFDAGCSVEDIGKMTLHDVRRLSTYAKKHPPIRVLVSYCAAALGVTLPEAEDQKKSKYLTAEEFRRIVQTTGGRVPGMGPEHG